MNRFLAPLAEPVGLLWLLLILTTLLCLWKRKLLAAFAPALLAVGLSLVGSTRLPYHWVAALERPYAGRQIDTLPAHDAVVMLGGTLEPSRNDPLGFSLNDAGDRALTALELVRSGKAKALVFGGARLNMATGPAIAEGDLLTRWAQRWNLASVPIYTLGPCTNTRDEALQTQALMQQQGWTRLLLVTSANHMRRAEALFHKLGLDVTCVACDFQGLTELDQAARFKPVPHVSGIRQLGFYLHEQVGWYYYRLRGWV